MTQSIWQTDCLIGSKYSGQDLIARERVAQPPGQPKTRYAIKRGEPVRREALPENLYLIGPKVDRESIPDYFRMTFPVLSKRFVQVLQAFDIGETRFYPIDLYQSDRKTKRPEKLFIMNIVSQKSCWDRAETRNYLYGWITDTHYNFNQNAADDYVAVKALARAGADLWCDPLLVGCMFVSDQLKQAISAAPLTPQIEFHRCKVTG